MSRRGRTARPFVRASGIATAVIVLASCGGDPATPGDDAAPTDASLEEPAVGAAPENDGEAASAVQLGEQLCTPFVGETIAGVGPLELQSNELIADTVWRCDYLTGDTSGAVGFAVSTTSDPALHQSFVDAGNGEPIDGLGESAVAVFAQDVRVITASGMTLIVRVDDYENPNDGGTFVDLDASADAARQVIDTLGLDG